LNGYDFYHFFIFDVVTLQTRRGTTGIKIIMVIAVAAEHWQNTVRAFYGAEM